jgi:glutaminyl-tRNA synthetase
MNTEADRNENKSVENDVRSDFIRDIIKEDNKTGKFKGKVATRFPPEPNGYLHIGHAKSINLNFGIAQDFGGEFHLRFDDTNPVKEETEYVESILNDVRWLGADWGKHLYYASDYFGDMHKYAIELIKQGKAYVCDCTHDQVSRLRGTLTEAGKPCPHRDRSIEENLDLFERMGKGEFPDPIMYRILHASHHRSGEKWCIYPMYDWAHGLEDSVEGITHSICTLEFENHRPLYDWFLDQLGAYHPQQIEFARLNLTYTVMSKRKLLELVKGNFVSGWDDPRMPTISGMRRRGYTPEAIRNFCKRIGVNKFNSTVDFQLLEYFVREDLNKRAPRVMGVLNPLKVVITNYPDGQVEEMDAVNNPEDATAGTRKVPFSKTLYIERDDFMENPPKKFFRLSPGKEVRLRYAYFITCTEVVKDANGEVIELRCTYDPATRGGDAPDGRKVKATLHWVSADRAVDAEVRLYDHLFTKPNPDDVEDGHDYKEGLSPESLKVLSGCKLEPSVKTAPAGTRYQFERQGYFCIDSDSTTEKLVFNRIATLKDTWAKIQSTEAGK